MKIIGGPSADDVLAADGDTLAQDLASARSRLAATRLLLIESDRRLAEVLASDSWVMTSPFRSLAQRAPRVTGIGLQAWKLAWWTASGQVLKRARSRRLARARRLGAGPAPEHRSPPVSRIPVARMTPPSASRGGRHILIIDQSVPEPDRHAGARATQAVISVLAAEGWSVTFYPHDQADAGDYTRNLEQDRVLVLDRRVEGGLVAWLAAYGAALDHVMLMRPGPSRDLLPTILHGTQAKLSYYGHDLHFARLRREAALHHDIDLAELADRMLAVERGIWRAVDIVLYLSDEEAATVRRLEPGVDARSVPIVAYGSFITRESPPPGETLLFVGNFAHTPNEDAALWFVREILPLIRSSRPTARLILAGSGPTPRIRALAGAGLEVTGYVSDPALTALYDQARVVVAPLRFGAGVKGKIVEALRLGVPVVTTRIGAEGLPDIESIIPIHDKPRPMADAITRLVTNDSAWTEQAARQVVYAKNHFSVMALHMALLGALEAG